MKTKFLEVTANAKDETQLIKTILHIGKNTINVANLYITPRGNDGN